MARDVSASRRVTRCGSKGGDMVATGVKSRTQNSRSGMNAIRDENRGKFGATPTALSGQALVKESKRERTHSCFGANERSAYWDDVFGKLAVAGRNPRTTQQRPMFSVIVLAAAERPAEEPERSASYVVLFDIVISQSTVEWHYACSFGSGVCTLGASSRTGPNPTHSELMDPQSRRYPLAAVHGPNTKHEEVDQDNYRAGVHR